MQSARDKAKAWRIALVGGIGSAIFVFSFARLLGLQETFEKEKFHSYLFDHADRWPSFMRSFLPLDLLVSCTFYVVLLYLFFGKLDNTPGPKNLKELCMLGLGVFVGFGSMGAVFGSTIIGWYSGLEMFFVFGALMSAVLAVLMSFMIGLIIGMDKLSLVIKHWWATHHLRPVARQLTRLSDYMEAKDIPEEPKGS